MFAFSSRSPAAAQIARRQTFPISHSTRRNFHTLFYKYFENLDFNFNFILNRTCPVSRKILELSKFNIFSHFTHSAYSKRVILTSPCNSSLNSTQVRMNVINFMGKNQTFFQFYSDPSYVIGLFPDLLPVEFRKQLEYPEMVPVLQGKELDLAVLALIKYLTEVNCTLFIC